jgi:membrane-anchored protein YejM (alkaline phosphatase superfamily)
MYADAQGDTRFTALTRYLPAYFPLKGKRTLARLGLVDPAVAERQRLLARADAGGGGQLRYPLAPLRCPAPPRTGQPANLLFVLIDALRPDAIDPRLTPNLAALRFEGQAFMNHWSGGNSSRAGLFPFFYGLPSTYLDAFYGVQQPPVLLTALRDRNYQLALFAAPGFGSPTDLDRTSFAGVPGLPGEAPDLSATARNQRVTQQWQDWLRRERDPARPFLAFLYYDPPMGDMAGDADPALPLGERFPPRADRKPDAPAAWAQYRRAARFADAEFGAVDAALGAAGLAGDTLLVVFSDHGYEFDDYGNGYLGHASDFSDAQLRATLLLRWPGRPAQRFAHRTSHFDVVPTLLGDWLGCTSPPADYATGRSLFAGVDWQWLIAGSYNAEAIVEPRRRTVTQPGGFVELRDNEYHPYAGPTPDPAVIEAALADQRRFYR